MLKANAKAKRKITDKQRLNWLRKNKINFHIVKIEGTMWCDLSMIYHRSPRQAIDAAMNSGGGK